jgi:hypothetical protein
VAKEKMTGKKLEDVSGGWMFVNKTYKDEKRTS